MDELDDVDCDELELELELLTLLDDEEDWLEDELDCEEVLDEDEDEDDDADEDDELDETLHCARNPRTHRRYTLISPAVRAAPVIRNLMYLSVVTLIMVAAAPVQSMSCSPTVPAVPIASVSRMSPVAPAAASSFIKIDAPAPTRATSTS